MKFNIVLLISLIYCIALNDANAQSKGILEDYIPFPESSILLHPEITIRVHVHVIQRTKEDPRNLTTDSLENLKQQFNWINSFYKTLSPPTLLTSNGEEHYVPDSRIRFRVDTIQFHVDSLDWDRMLFGVNTNGSAPYTIDSISLMDNHFLIKGKYLVNRFRTLDSIVVIDAGLNSGNYILKDVFPKGNHTVLSVEQPILKNEPIGGLSYYRKLDKNCRKDIWEKYTNSDKNALHVFFTGSSISKVAFGCGPSPYFLNVSKINSKAYAVAQLIAHELGHTIGLHHTNYPQFNDLPNTDKFGFIPCNSNNTSNNIMGYNKCRRYLSPKQIAHVHRRYTMDSNLVRLTTANEYNPENNLEIWMDTIWNSGKIITGDLIIRKRVKLVVNTQVHLSKGSAIYLEKKAEIIIDGGSATNFFETGWAGIVNCRSYERSHKPVRRAKNRGKTTLLNHGKILNVN